MARTRPVRRLFLAGAAASLACGLCFRALCVALAPGKYRTLTRIRLRESPSVDAAPTGDRLEKGEVFEAEEVSAGGNDLSYLKVQGRGGWVFDKGIAGAWVGQAILEAVEKVQAEAVAAEPVAAEPVATAPVSTAPTDYVSAEPVVALGAARVESLRLPDTMLGAGYELMSLEAEGARQPLTFLLATAFPINALTPKGREILPGNSMQYTGGWLSQATAAASKVDLTGIKIGAGAMLDDIKDLEVLDIPQAALLEQLGIEIHGVLGKPFFELYDMDFDRYRQTAQIYHAGQAAAEGFYSTVRHMPGIELPAGNLGVVLTGHAVDDDLDDKSVSFVGLVDSGAAHTVINWEAAKLLGYSGPTDPKLVAATKVLGASKTGQTEEMPVVRAKFELCGVPEVVKPMMERVTKEEFDAGGAKGWFFQEEGLAKDRRGCLQLGAVNVAIGDVLGLTVLTDSMIGPFTGAAAIVGQDLLFQLQRVVVNMKEKNLWVEPGDIRDEPEM